MNPYRLHVFVCLGKRCVARGAEELLETVKEKIKAAGLKPEVKTSRTGCMNVCKETSEEGEFSATMVVYPDGVWYRNVTAADVDEIVEEHIKNGRTVKRLLHFSMS